MNDLDDYLPMRIFTPEPEYTLRIFGFNSEPLITLKPDGTVVIHKEGADKEAAKVFYETLQIYGKSLHQEIERLRAEKEIERLRAEVDRLSGELTKHEYT
jgi:hypothetical protein